MAPRGYRMPVLFAKLRKSEVYCGLVGELPERSANLLSFRWYWMRGPTPRRADRAFAAAVAALVRAIAASAASTGTVDV
jgi:hypothetical protein